MPKSTSPFAGMKLTNQTPIAQSGVDQKLFSHPAPPPEKPVKEEAAEKKEQKAPNTHVLVKPRSLKPIAFPINQTAR